MGNSVNEGPFLGPSNPNFRVQGRALGLIFQPPCVQGPLDPEAKTHGQGLLLGIVRHLPIGSA